MGLICGINYYSLLPILAGIILGCVIIYIRKYSYTRWILTIEEDAERTAIRKLLESWDVDSVGYKLTTGWHSLYDEADCKNIFTKHNRSENTYIVRKFSLSNKWNNFISGAFNISPEYLTWDIKECAECGFIVYRTVSTEGLKSIFVLNPGLVTMFSKSTKHYQNSLVYEWKDL